jgi:predicted nucleic acid-binding Zn ribbon protein
MLFDEKQRVRAYRERMQRRRDMITLALIAALIVTMAMLR